MNTVGWADFQFSYHNVSKHLKNQGELKNNFFVAKMSFVEAKNKINKGFCFGFACFPGLYLLYCKAIFQFWEKINF